MYHKYLRFNYCSIVVSNYIMIILAYVTTMKLHKLDICFILLQLRWNLNNVNRFVSTVLLTKRILSTDKILDVKIICQLLQPVIEIDSLLQCLIRHYIKHIILLALLPVPMPEAFLRVLRFFPLLKKTTTTFPTSTSILNARSLLNNFLINLKCFRDKQITFPSFLSSLLLKKSYSQGFSLSITYVTIEKLQSSLSIYE